MIWSEGGRGELRAQSVGGGEVGGECSKSKDFFGWIQVSVRPRTELKLWSKGNKTWPQLDPRLAVPQRQLQKWSTNTISRLFISYSSECWKCPPNICLILSLRYVNVILTIPMAWCRHRGTVGDVVDSLPWQSPIWQPPIWQQRCSNHLLTGRPRRAATVKIGFLWVSFRGMIASYFAL